MTGAIWGARRLRRLRRRGGEPAFEDLALFGVWGLGFGV